MTLTFVDNPRKDQPVVVHCPACAKQVELRYAPKRRWLEICPCCTRRFTVQTFISGLVLVE